MTRSDWINLGKQQGWLRPTGKVEPNPPTKNIQVAEPPGTKRIRKLMGYDEI